MSKNSKEILAFSVVVLLAAIIGFILSISATTVLKYKDKVDTIENQTSPVVTDMRIIEYKRGPKFLWIHVVGNKVRNDCGTLEGIWGEHGQLPGKRLSTIVFVNDIDEATGAISLPSPRATGENNDFGWWKLQPRDADMPLWFSTAHICNGQVVLTKIGPLTISIEQELEE